MMMVPQDTLLSLTDTLGKLADTAEVVARGLGGKTGAWYDRPALIAVLGMLWHTYIKWQDHKRRPGQPAPPFRAYALARERMGATILGLTILGLWAINVPIPILPQLLPMLGLNVSITHIRDILPYHWVTALAIGYMMDSLVKELVKKIPWLGRAFNIQLHRNRVTGDMTISEPMKAVPPPPGFGEEKP